MIQLNISLIITSIVDNSENTSEYNRRLIKKKVLIKNKLGRNHILKPMTSYVKRWWRCLTIFCKTKEISTLMLKLSLPWSGKKHYIKIEIVRSTF